MPTTGERNLQGFARTDRIIALVARYHRTGKPRKTNDAYRRLRRPARQAVKTLAAILALAEASTATTPRSSTTSSSSRIPTRRWRRSGSPRNDAELELWAAQHVAPLESLLGCPVRIERVARHAPAVAVATPRASAGARGRAKGRHRTTTRRPRARQTPA
jgi:hypothetical protein